MKLKTKSCRNIMSNCRHWRHMTETLMTTLGLSGVVQHAGNPTLTHWGRATHICVSKLTTIGSDNGLSPGWRQASIWTNAGILSIGPLGTKFSEILMEIRNFYSRKCIWICRLENGGHFVSASMCQWWQMMRKESGLSSLSWLMGVCGFQCSVCSF